MPRIATFMYCERAEPTQQMKLMISHPLLVINPVFVPGLFSFSIVFGLVGADPNVNHTMKVLFLNEKNEVIIDSDTIPLPAGAMPKIQLGLPEEQTGFMFNMDYRNVIFQTEGLYKTHVYFDDEMMGEFPIFVKGGGAQ